jgi:predicted Zn finger-like uncharacterized protein
MYTQCPECDVAFRVTADVLRQAAGKVRCGGCGIAFNALEHLSEEKPQPPTRMDPEPELPELTPEPPPELEADTPPQVISAKQSAALLKTLDQLAGSDIRIEDTGIEWRVLDSDLDAVSEPAEEPEAVPEPEFEAVTEPAEEPDADPVAETGSLKFFIEDESDQPEIVEEMRFDDNTPLPDDFEFKDVVVAAPEPAPAEVEEAEVVDELQGAQVDLAFGDAEEWEDFRTPQKKLTKTSQLKPTILSCSGAARQSARQTNLSTWIRNSLFRPRPWVSTLVACTHQSTRNSLKLMTPKPRHRLTMT